MPNIVEYTAKAELEPSDRGIQAAELAGRRLGVFGQQIRADFDEASQKITQHMEVMEASELYKTGTELKLNLQKRYEEESGLPENRNDPHFGDRFMAEVGPLLDQWGSNVHTPRGKELAATLKGNIRSEIFNHVAAGQSEMDAAHVEDNLNQTINTLSAGLQLDPSEGNLNRTLDTARTAIEGMTAAIPDVRTREDVAKRLTAERLPQLVASRYQAAFESIKQQVSATGDETKSPAYAQTGQDIAKQTGFQYLPPEAQARLSNLRDEAVRQGIDLYKAHDAVQRKQDGDDFDSAMVKIESSMYQSDGAGGVKIVVPPDALAAAQRAAAMPGAKQFPGRVESLLNLMHTATQDIRDNKETPTDQHTYVDFSARIGSTVNPLTKSEVDDARANHLLSDSDYHFLHEAASDSKAANPKINHAVTEMNQWLEKMKPMIDKSTFGNLDPTGAEKFYGFSWGAQEALRRAIAAGNDPEKAVQELTNPSNPNGLYHNMPATETQKQGLAAVRAAIHGGVRPGVEQQTPVAPAKPGESPADYLKRTAQ